MQLERHLMSSWLVRPAPKPVAAVRLFCVPYAGVGPSVFRGWSQALPEDVEALYVHLPGRESRLREIVVPDISRLASDIADALSPFTEQPFALFGHSIGALIAFEVARSLRRAGSPAPIRLFVSACRAPQLPHPYPPLHLLNEDEFLQRVNERYGGSVPREVIENSELRELVVPALRGDFAALELYERHTEPPLDCPITAFGGVSDPTLNTSALDAWGVQTTSSFRLRIVDGGHFYLQSARQQLLAAIAEDIGSRCGLLTEGCA